MLRRIGGEAVGAGTRPQIIAHIGDGCKTVGSAYVGSNPTPATTQSPRSRAYAQLYDPAKGGTARCHGLVVSVGAFPLVRGLDAQAAFRRWPMARQMRGEASGRGYPNPSPAIANRRSGARHGAGADTNGAVSETVGGMRNESSARVGASPRFFVV